VTSSLLPSALSSAPLFAAEASVSVPGIFEMVWIVPAVMAASFLVILFGSKRLGVTAHFIGIPAVVFAFIFSLTIAGSWIGYVGDVADSHGGGEEALAFVDDEENGTDEHGTEVDGADAGHASSAGESCITDGHAGESDDGEHSHDEDALAPAGLAFAEEGEGHVSPCPIVTQTTWFENGGPAAEGGSDIQIGTFVDGQSVLLLVVVTFISMLVHIFSTDYVGGDRRYTHYFAFLSLFTASMLFYVLSSSTLQMIVGWELVGVCSFALIGHWWEEKPNSDAALKAFLTNRVGDIGLLIGMIILYFAAGRTFDIQAINEAAVSGAISKNTLLIASLCLMAAVMSKSGQFILHTWLPDAMAGPTPVSALIHAATMVVAGVYLIGRLYPVFYIGMGIADSSLNPLALVGGITCVGGGLLAFVQRDIKKVLAYSTVSQLGYMVLALGVGAYTAGMFHLFTHAIFKACLFLGAGSLSHACHHSFDMKADMGGLRKVMPKTFWTFIIGSGALAGLPPLAGFWSKDEILVGAGVWPGTGGNGTYYVPFIFGMLTAAMTAAYMTRVIWLTFFGKYRGHVTPHESGPRITVPLIILAVGAVFAGFLNVPKELPVLGSRFGLWFEEMVEPAGIASFPRISHGTPSLSLAIVASLLAVGAGAAVWSYYKRLYAIDATATEYTNHWADNNRLIKAGHTLLVEKFYLDHLYTGAIAGAAKGWAADVAYWFNQNVLDGVVNTVGTGTTAVGRFVYKYIDQGAIDGAVNGSGIGASESGQLLRKVQSGKIRQYATLMFGAAAVLAAVFIVVV
jgi:NADH-quinone oxidoreductase subunit L